MLTDNIPSVGDVNIGVGAGHGVPQLIHSPPERNEFGGHPFEQYPIPVGGIGFTDGTIIHSGSQI